MYFDVGRLGVLALAATVGFSFHAASEGGDLEAAIPDTWLQTARLAAADLPSAEHFGHAVALHDDLLIVGAPGESRAHLFELRGEEWGLEAVLEVDGTPWWSGFGESVAVGDSVALVGAPGQARAYVFEKVDGQWDLTKSLMSPDGNADSNFGAALALHGDTAVIGAPRSDAPGTPRQGAAFVYERSASGWALDAPLTADLGKNAYLGWSVSTDGATIVAGAAGVRVAVVYERDLAGWSETARLASSKPYDGFAKTVAVAGQVVAVGAPFHWLDGGVAPGAVHVYERTGAIWVEDSVLLPSDVAPMERRAQFGLGLALGGPGPTLAVGAPLEDVTPGPLAVPGEPRDETCVTTGDASPTCHPPGAVYLFSRDPDGWSQTAKLTAVEEPPAQFRQLGEPANVGYSVSLDATATKLLAGAPRSDVFPGDEVGAAYLFSSISQEVLS